MHMQIWCQTRQIVNPMIIRCQFSNKYFYFFISMKHFYDDLHCFSNLSTRKLRHSSSISNQRKRIEFFKRWTWQPLFFTHVDEELRIGWLFDKFLLQSISSFSTCLFCTNSAAQTCQDFLDNLSCWLSFCEFSYWITNGSSWPIS